MSLLTDLSCYYKLDGDATKSFGTNDGTANNTTFAAGKISQAATFSGIVTSNILVADSTDFTFGSNDFSVSMWVKKTTNGTRQIFAGQSSALGTTSTISFLLEFRTTNTVRAIVAYNTSTTSLPESSGTITDTAWHHIVLVRDGSTMRLYIDGSADGTAAISGTVNDATNNFGLGRGGDINQNFFPGSIDEVGVWKRKLTPAEVGQLYNSGNGLTYPFSTSASSNFFMFF